MSERQVQLWAREGAVERVGRGQYDLLASLSRLLVHYREQAAGRRSQDGTVDLVAERARLDAARARSQELKNAELEGALLRRADVVETWTTHLVAVKNRLRAIPKGLATRVPGVTQAVAREMLRGIDEALHELAGSDGVSGRPRRRGVGRGRPRARAAAGDPA